MQALQELYSETDKSHSELRESNRKSEETISQLYSENKMLAEKLENLEDSEVEIKVSYCYSYWYCHY